SSAQLSDVLQAVEWAVENREQLAIDALSISLSDSSTHAGFCDADEPVAAQVFASARAAGIAVVAAAGNAGRADGIAFPACLTDVVAAGMVYAAGGGASAWSEAGCEDHLVGPDRVPCASNSSPALSLLAPGVRWITQVPGGGSTSSFSGTSAAT